MTGMKITYPDYFFRPEDFLLSSNIAKNPFMADVTALVTTTGLEIDVEVTSIRFGEREIVAYLRKDAEWEMAPILRSFYLNAARAGNEGDVVNG